MNNTYTAMTPKTETEKIITICNALDLLKEAGVTIKQFAIEANIHTSALYQMRYTHRANAVICGKALKTLQQNYQQLYEEAFYNCVSASI